MIPAPCNHLCNKGLNRFHLTCLFCRRRRWATGEIKSPEYSRANFKYTIEYTPEGKFILPRNVGGYLLIINKERRHYKIKEQLLKRVLTLAELLAN